MGLQHQRAAGAARVLGFGVEARRLLSGISRSELVIVRFSSGFGSRVWDALRFQFCASWLLKQEVPVRHAAFKEVFPTYLGLFEPVDGGTDRACRGHARFRIQVFRPR